MKILFVCLGNICRSPLAEELFRRHIHASGLSGHYTIDSCGTGNWHQGELPDPRTRKTAEQKGVVLTHRARQIKESDFEQFDHLLVMDHNNYRDVCAIRKDLAHKVNLLTEFSRNFKGMVIPDPYFGDEAGFEQVHELLDNVSAEIAEHFNQTYR